MKRLQSIFKKKQPQIPSISRRTQLTSGEVWQSETSFSEKVASSNSIDLQEQLDQIIDQRYRQHEQLKILAEEEKKIAEEKKKIKEKKKNIEEAKKKIEEDEKMIEEKEKILEEQEKNIAQAKNRMKQIKKNEEEEEED